MAINFELNNDEFAYLFFYLQLNEKNFDDPLMGKLIFKMENIIYSRFSIDEIETYRNKVFGSRAFGDVK